MTNVDDTPKSRLARWTTIDAAIGLAAEAEQFREQLAQRVAELDDLRARLSQLTTRVAQVEAENADLRRNASRMPMTSVARRVYRRARSVAASRLPR